MNPAAEAASRYRDLIRQVFGEDRLAEDTGLEAIAARPPELELQSRWYAGDFGRDFSTTTGERVEIVQFGIWNHSAGPDFREAVVKIDGKVCAGDLEFDPEARDWERHGHAQNPGYDQVVLHLFTAQPEQERFFTRTSTHRNVPQVLLDLGRLNPRRIPDYLTAEAKWGRCSFPLQHLPALKIESLLAGAARHRLDLKARRLRRLADVHGEDQALYQEIAAGLGYRRNKLPMTVLAQRLPLKMLHQRRDEAEALIFGVSGFLESRVYETAEPDTREYLRVLWETWWKHRAAHQGPAPLPWVLSGSRPANHPQRRIGALALVAGSWKSIRASLDRSVDTFSETLESLSHPYWDYHYTLTSKRSPKRMAVLGGTRVLDLLANLAYPWISLRLDSWWPAYAKLTAPTENEKSRRAAIRLFGQRDDAPNFTRRLFHHQALIQIYEDFCLQDQTDCAKCLFPEQLRQWE